MADPASPSTVRSLLRERTLRPNKRLGQNFLCDRNVLERIADACDLGPSDQVVEIGAGMGGLTLSLAARALHVTAIEIDRRMIPILEETVGHLSNVSVLHADFLRLDVAELLRSTPTEPSGVIAGNIPYGITTPILERCIDHKALLKRVVLLVQTEVADRLTAEPGTKEYGSLSVLIQYHGAVRAAGQVPRHLFMPAPDVSSTLIVFEPASPGVVPVQCEQTLVRLVRSAFGHRRKTLPNALAAGGLVDRPADALEPLREAGIDPGVRAETLSLAEFAAAADAFYRMRPDAGALPTASDRRQPLSRRQ